MTRLKLVHDAKAVMDDRQDGVRVEIDPNDTIAALLGDLDRSPRMDPELARRSAACIRELTRQRDEASHLMQECAQHLNAALERLRLLKGRMGLAVAGN